MGRRRATDASLYDPTHDIERLREYLATVSIRSLCRYMENLSTISDGALLAHQLGLKSPYREISYALGLCATTPEPRNPVPLDEYRLVALLEAVHDRYGARYFRPDSRAGRDQLQAAFAAFVKRVFEGQFLGIPQLKRRICDYLAPFDALLLETAGLSATEALNVANAIGELLQADLDRLNEMYRFSRSPILSQAARAEEAKRASNAFDAHTRTVSIQALEREVGTDLMRRYSEIFVLQRGCVHEFFWFDDQRNPYEERPVVLLDRGRLAVPVANTMFIAIWRWAVHSLVGSPRSEPFLYHRGRQLERDALQAVSRLVPDGKFYPSAYERPGHDEHDILVLRGDVAIVIEAKAGKPPPAMRDLDLAFKYVKQQFYSDTGIQSGYDQGKRLARRLLHDPKPVVLYDKNQNVILTVQPGTVKKAYVIIVTLEEYGMLATDLTTLLKREADEPFPWAVNIYDLELFADVFIEKREWGSEQFLQWLDERHDSMVRRNFITGDELEIAGIFVTHGTLRDFPSDSVVVGLRHYANVFEDFAHEKIGDFPAELADVEPADVQGMLQIASTDRDTVVAKRIAEMNLGRNDICPCGSQKKYKKCHGA